MAVKDSILTSERFRELFDYDKKTGVFTRRVKQVRGLVGSHPGTPGTNGRIVFRVDGRLYLAHRLAWLHVYGNWPKQLIDHINGDPTDNRIINLRDGSQFLNMQNLRAPTVKSTTQFLGVSRNHDRFRATIRVDGKWKFIGNFLTPEEAAAAYLEFKRKHHAGCTI